MSWPRLIVGVANGLRPGGSAFRPLACTSSFSSYISFPRSHQWNKNVAEAEKLVGFPTSMMSFQNLMDNDVTSMTSHVKKLLGSGHPLLKTLKRLVYHDKNNLQVRGLMVLLICRAFSGQFVDVSDRHADTGILDRQRQLAEYLEMILSAQAIHKSVLNLPNLHDGRDVQGKDDLLELEYGNKIAILGGDYLLAQACVGLANLRNTYISEMISVAIADFTQSEFLGRRDIQGRFIPDPSHITQESWVIRNTLAYGNLMSQGCKSVMLLADMDPQSQELACRLGHNLSLALQAYSELEPFLEETISPREILDLSAAPVLFHLQEDPELLHEVQHPEDNNTENLNTKKILNAIMAKRVGLDRTQDLINIYVQEALEGIQKLPNGQNESGKSAKNLLEEFVAFLRA
ncbi:hypothetical protein TCAL_12303 [Tigriopus californicus]|uniref:Decaprenyl-diphosphate synthase subunit 2 n=1 Tax=Tigriopus californicus TaxID=6832 RepID=A0A553NCH9_TIGCA|nr:all trans-polyprenyl-diphosphate synthase PDSS2-like [Tigriopus californicus]TRY63137.1 hypothetical protein TCAL_12303 [Tigriopus californicus]|eukprot:TCALIF_12303-PA protein Name:"Similar to Pdss2 Decaprenyl-diphosphate synthase subunit 2 (Rattus norvegicus)" AED:0.01 eAED:0.01 QI:463/1/1/1/1/1/3/129/402